MLTMTETSVEGLVDEVEDCIEVVGEVEDGVDVKVEDFEVDVDDVVCVEVVEVVDGDVEVVDADFEVVVEVAELTLDTAAVSSLPSV